MTTGFDHRVWMALLYAASAVVCVLAEPFGEAVARGQASASFVWRWAAVLLLAMALVTLLRLDQSFVIWVRQLAKHADWYAQRRPMQALTLLLLAGMALWLQSTGRLALGQNLLQAPAMLTLSLGLSLLLVLTALRFVSLHHTDLVLNWRVANISVGRLLELSGLGLVLLASGLHMLRKDG